jgi:hypothetical protein
MTLIKVLARRLELESARPAISIQRPRLVGSAQNDAGHDEEQPLADRVFLFLDQRSA